MFSLDVISKCKQLNDLSYPMFTKLYNAGVVPVQDYGAEVWGYSKHESCNTVHHRALRFFFGVHKYAPIAAMQGDINWVPPIYRRWVVIIRFWNRLINMTDNRLTKQVFLSDLNECNNNNNNDNWCSDVKRILSIVDLSDVFENRSMCEITKFKSECNIIIFNKWHESINSKPKLRTYKLFKSDLFTEAYVKCFLNRKKRSLFAQLRFGILPLRIETGRFSNTPINERICQFCNYNEIEDEFHFLCKCTLYDGLRKNMIEQVCKENTGFIDYTDHDKFIFLMNNCWRVLINLYLVPAFEKRTNRLYIENRI